jgi:hypothetical protein
MNNGRCSKRLSFITRRIPCTSRSFTYAPSPERKKSELLAELDKLFADAVEGKLEDKTLAEKVNQWLPVNLRPA